MPKLSSGTALHKVWDVIQQRWFRLNGSLKSVLFITLRGFSLQPLDLKPKQEAR